MYWPDTNTGVDEAPARKPVSSFVRKYFSEGGAGHPPTVPGGDWFNQITNELLNVLAAAGIDPSKAEDDQLEKAIRNLIAGGFSFDGFLVADAGFDPVPSYDDGGANGNMNDQAQALVNRTELLKNAQVVNNVSSDTYGSKSSAITHSRRQKKTDNHIWFLGDSHSWGQGSPEYNDYLSLGNVSTRSSMLGNRGFVAQTIESILRSRGWDPKTYLSAAISVSTTPMSGDYSDTVNGTDAEKVSSVTLVAGSITSAQVAMKSERTRSCDRFYKPLAWGDTYSVSQYREKVAIGRFLDRVMTLQHESHQNFMVDTKKHFFRFPMHQDWLVNAVGVTQVVGDGGGVVAERNSTTGQIVIVSKPNLQLPIWMFVGTPFYLPGYGNIKITAVAGNGGLTVVNADGTLPPVTIMKYFHQGFTVYPAAYFDRAVVSVDFTAPHRRAYIAAVTGPTRGVMRVYFTDSISAGGRNDPYLSLATLSKRSNPYSPTNPDPQVIYVYSMKQDGSFNPSDATVTIGSNYVDLNCTTASEEEVIYVIDFGGKTFGRLFIESVDSSRSIGIRGVVFDNNNVINYAMGGHTVGAWLGLAAVGGDTTDHIANFLKYTPVKPSTVLVQVPFVNEYLNQTTLSDFANNLALLVSKVRAHLPLGQNPIDTTFIFYTTLRNKLVAFQGGASSPVTYDMYVQAVKDFCVAGSHEFIDIENLLLDVPARLGISYERLFNDNNHPSDFTNMLLADQLKFHVSIVS